MKVLQLGSQDWRQKYKIPAGLDWHYNDFPESTVIISGKGPQKPKRYSLVIIAGPVSLKGKDWQQLQWLVNPYDVLYVPTNKDKLSTQAKKFLKEETAQPIQEELQFLIDHLQERYFSDQSGIRFSPQNFLFNETAVDQFTYPDSHHVLFEVNTNSQWTYLGSYRISAYLDPNKTFDFWLEAKSKGVKLRLRFYLQPSTGDGDPAQNKVYQIDDSSQEWHLQLAASKEERFTSVVLEGKGKGKVCLGDFHERWSRQGLGVFFPGGQRIVNPHNREEIAFYFNPGDLKPPLNVYFSGARQLEGFEAYPLFRSLHAPALLFTDMRLEVGQFYDDAAGFMAAQIKKTILKYLHKLHFGRSQLIMNGISMGTYPALKYGADLGVYMINVAKPLADLGYIASRYALQRPGQFAAIFDIDFQIAGDLTTDSLQKMDQEFWQEFNRQDLRKTRVFVSYMKNDDYDNHALSKLKASPAIDKAAQFSYKGFAGRHNDDPTVTNWFISRLKEVMSQDFERKF